MKLNSYGYTKETIEVRQITIGDLILGIAQELITQSRESMEIRIMDADVGTVDSFRGLLSLLTNDWNAGWEINLYKAAIIEDRETEKRYFLAIISDAEPDGEEEAE